MLQSYRRLQRIHVQFFGGALCVDRDLSNEVVLHNVWVAHFCTLFECVMLSIDCYQAMP
jgi:hypothetical protein